MRDKRDRIFAWGGDDCIDGRGGNDTVDGGDDIDRIWGGRGNDECMNREIQFSCAN